MGDAPSNCHLHVIHQHLEGVQPSFVMRQTSLVHLPVLEGAQATPTWRVHKRILTVGRTLLVHPPTLEGAQASLMEIIGSEKVTPAHQLRQICYEKSSVQFRIFLL